MDGFGTSTPGSQPVSQAGFDFTRHIRVVCADIVSRLAELGHVDFRRVAVSSTQTRRRSVYGTYATLTPMRFQDGSLFTVKGGRRYTVQRLYDSAGNEMLYILTFYLPRFLDVDLLEKLTTIVHELWHISPNFDGDIRRHAGRYYAHTRSQQHYDAAMSRLARRWLESSPPEHVYRFLRYDFAQLRNRYGRVRGVRIRHPQLVPCPQ